LFRAIVFAVLRSGFRARCALETDDGAEVRLNKIQAIVEACRFGIHDLSRTESDGDPPLPRFNMPMELGLFLGARRYGDDLQRKKRALILDTHQYRYQRFISDIAGQDIKAHSGDPLAAIECVVTWLRSQSRSTTIPGGKAVVREFQEFEAELPAILEAHQLTAGEMTFGDYVTIVVAWVTDD
jgi:hypothetical protein